MWLTHIKEQYIQNELKTKQIAQYKNDISDVKVLNSANTKNILILNDDILFTQKDWSIQSEMLAHIPLCSHPSPENILLIGYDTKVIEHILKHKDAKNITVLDVDQNISKAINEHFLDKDINDTRVKVINTDMQDFLADKDENLYDIILLNIMPSYIKNKEIIYSDISKMLKDDGIFISKFMPWQEDELAQKDILKNIGEYFKILMPYYFSMTMQSYCMGSFLFAGNKFHPTADIILHKSDLLDDNAYYTGDIHKASFCVPNSIDKTYRNFVKK
ncbi:Spermidine synthase [hydrothermal vent metagenome]|uniref:Spermidine synthase n=1 Tax=hydrothermal vent metagenome TaxID=652676 RepID=A0A3B1E8Z7_9ZZZZ